MENYTTLSASDSINIEQINVENLPVVSVCIVTYNHEAYIREALEGVLSQKLNVRYEIVIGEDRSKDNTLAICEEYYQKYPNIIRILETPHNLGAMQNFIRTLKACRGEYIAVLDGDDYWIDAQKLQKQLSFIQNDPEVTLSFTGWKEFNDSSRTYNNVQFAEGQGYFMIEQFAQNTYFHTSTLVFRKPKNQKWLENLAHFKIGDRPLYITLLHELGGYAHKLEDITSVFRVNMNSTFTPTMPLDRTLNVAAMYQELRRLYPHLAVHFNQRLDVMEYFLLRDAYRNKDKQHVKKLAKNILSRRTKPNGWFLKSKALLHYFI